MRLQKSKIRGFVIQYALYILILLLWLFYGLQSEHFFTIRNVRTLLTNAAPMLVYACGMTYILILGEIDLSIGSVGAVAAACWMLSMEYLNMPLSVAFLIAMAVGAVCGLIAATLVVRLRSQRFHGFIGYAVRPARRVLSGGTGGDQILTPAAGP